MDRGSFEKYFNTKQNEKRKFDFCGHHLPGRIVSNGWLWLIQNIFVCLQSTPEEGAYHKNADLPGWETDSER